MKETVIIVFLKAPEPGKVKTRLSCDLGETFALSLYKGFVLDLFDMLRPFSTVAVYFWPPEKKEMVRGFVPDSLPCFEQKGADLGEKMANAFSQMFDRGAGKAILIGTDIPEITSEILKKAEKALDSADAVFGPTPDGGYYLTGFNHNAFDPDVFCNIPWSTPAVFSKTEEIMAQKQMSRTLVDRLEDIDTVAAFERLRQRAQKDPAARIGKRTLQIIERYGT